jgi:purine-binding chemotaxis protein CheW
MSALLLRRGDDSLSRWVCFGLGTQCYGLPILRVREVLRDAAIEPVPGTGAQVLGVINLRGQVVTVLDLSVRLGLPPADDHNDVRIVVVEYRQELFGLRVDCVADVRKINDSAVMPAPEVGAVRADGVPAAMCGLYLRDGELLTLLDADALIAGARFLA